MNFPPVDKQTVLRILLDNFQVDRVKYLERLVTQVDTLAYQFDPESKSQSKQLEQPGSPKQFKLVASIGKVMTSVFWDCELQ